MVLLPMFYKGLTPELIEKAEKELNETPEVKAKALFKLRQLIDDKLVPENINCRLDDEFLMRFLRVKKFDVEVSLNVLRNYYKFQHKHSGRFTHIKPSEVKNDFDTNAIFYPSCRVEDGSHITILKMSNYKPLLTTAENFVALIIIWGELIMECEASQISGANLIVDLKDATFEQYRSFLTIPFMKFIFDTFTDNWPMRIRGIHILNEPFIFHALHSAIKPFLKKKLIEKIHFHGDDYDSLYKYVPKDCLPEEFGGILGPIDCKEFRTFFFKQEAFFEKIYKYGICEKKK